MAIRDDELIQMIADAYREEGLRLPMDALTRRSTPRPLLRLAVAAAAVSVLIALAAVAFAFGGPRGTVEPAQPSPTPSNTQQSGGKPPRPTTTATTDAGRCGDIAVQVTGGPTLPPLRFALTGPDPRLRLRLYGEGRTHVACWLNSDRVDVNGSSVVVEPTREPFYSMAAYGIDIPGGEYATGPAEYAFGQTMPGTTRVEIYFATGNPIMCELGEGWWAVLLVGYHRLDQSTQIRMYTPAGMISIPVQHG
jgi:hypothetical protein